MYKQTNLNYKFDELEPYIDKETMEIHYNRHHKAYCDKFNSVVEKYPKLKEKTAEEIIKNLNSLPFSEEDKINIRNNGGGFINHNLFWETMDPKNSKDDSLIKEIEMKFGSLDKFKEMFSESALNHFGSGWTWLVRKENQELEIYSLSNQDSPLTLGDEPLIGLDLWEHAYYLKYQNQRAEYIKNWWNTLKIL